MKPYLYDPARAKALLAQAGFPNGFEANALTRSTSPGAEMPLQAQAVASYWDKIGVKAKLNKIDYAAGLPDTRKGAVSGKIWFHRFIRYSDYWQAMTGQLMPGPQASMQVWHDDNLTMMLREADRMKDPKARVDKIREITKYNYENVVAVPLTVVDNLYGISDKVGNWPVLEGGYAVFTEYITQAKPLGTFRLFEP